LAIARFRTSADLLISGSNQSLDGNLNRDCEPTQPIRVRDPLRPLNLTDPLLGGAGLPALGLGGVADPPSDIGLRQAKPAALFHHEPAKR
jgi:hypothetical protein